MRACVWLCGCMVVVAAAEGAIVTAPPCGCCCFKAPRPEGVQLDTDWIRPGDLKLRRKLVKMLIAEVR